MHQPPNPQHDVAPHYRHRTVRAESDALRGGVLRIPHRSPVSSRRNIDGAQPPGQARLHRATIGKHISSKLLLPSILSSATSCFEYERTTVTVQMHHVHRLRVPVASRLVEYNAQ